MQETRILPSGDQGLVVEFGNCIDPAINRNVHQLAARLNAVKNRGIRETVPTYRSLLVYFIPEQLSREQAAKLVQDCMQGLGETGTEQETARIIHIPVCYGGDFGPDLEFVAEHNQLSCEQVINIHTSVPYLVYMLGFTPGFPYLGGMSDQIATPRLSKPRTLIPAGSVGIAGSQTGFYPVDSPGGWQLIGRTPSKGYDPRLEQPFLAAAGDYLQFHSITPEEYAKIKTLADEGEYRPDITPWEKGGTAS